MKTACVILAAGKGTRMRTSHPKVLHPVCGEPMISFVVQLALRSKFDPIVVVVSKQADEIRAFLSARFHDRVRFAVQDPPMGTGHAVLSSQDALVHHTGKLIIMYGDVPLVEPADLTALKKASNGVAAAFISVRLDDPGGYGRVVRDELGCVVRIVEHSDATKQQRMLTEVNAGLYCVDAGFTFQTLRKTKHNNAQGEVYLTDLIEQANASGFSVRGVERSNAMNFRGVNSRVELAQAEKIMNRRLLEQMMKSGVTVVDPDSTWIGPNVRIGRDSVVLPNCWFRGEVKIGSECILGPGLVVQNSRVGSKTHVRAHSVLEDCRIGDGARIGPFARIRPGTNVHSKAQVGNFVEIKKSVLGPGSKANHLSYLGDATIGADVNIGAGTITCNYDGVNKHPTIIEDGAFIGSDTQLVAPVNVGKNATIGAGTTVTSDVPKDALAVSRVAQKNIEGYAGLKRKRKIKKNNPPK